MKVEIPMGAEAVPGGYEVKTASVGLMLCYKARNATGSGFVQCRCMIHQHKKTGAPALLITESSTPAGELSGF